MAYRGETAGGLAGAVQNGPMVEQQAPVAQSAVIADDDVRRVRIGLMAIGLLAALDLALYLPRLF
jgi:hypothetical protein